MGVERPAEAALRQRMTDLLQQLELNSGQAQEEQQGAGGTSTNGSGGGGSGQTGRGRRTPKSSPEHASRLLFNENVEIISTLLDALGNEHAHLHQLVLLPITSFVCEMLPVRSAVLRHVGLQRSSSSSVCGNGA
jgi:hypothetical protein